MQSNKCYTVLPCRHCAVSCSPVILSFQMTEPGAKTHRGLCPMFDRERAENQGISMCAGLTGKFAVTLGTGTKKTKNKRYPRLA